MRPAELDFPRKAVMLPILRVGEGCMVTTVKSRPSHYEMLGLRPEASADEIARAFAEKMSLAGTRPMIEVTQVCTAYETLRDPDRRRAYDEGLGLGRKPEKREAAV